MKKILFLFLLPFLLGCSKKVDVETQKKTVLVTIAPYAFVTEYIGRNTISVETLVPPGMNLHVYEPTPRQVEKTSQATIWFRIDEPFEKKIARVFQENNPSQKMVNLQEGLALLGHGDAVELSPCGEAHGHGSEDLHTWLSPKIMQKQAKRIALELESLFPENKVLYEKNLKLLINELEKLDTSLANHLNPFKGDALLVSHPAFGYFCKDYGLIQLSVECEGKDPRPKDVERILKQAGKYQVRSVFLQQGFNNRGAALIAEKLKLKSHSVDPYAKDYLKNMQQIADYIQ